MKKKLLVTICISIMVCVLMACGSSKGPVKTVIEEIDSIGYVKKESVTKIETARADYERLSDDEKAKVTNYQKLIDAEYDLDKIFAQKIDDMIDEIDSKEIDDTIPEKIESVKQAYEALTKEQKAYVNKYDKLDSIMDKYNEYLVDNIVDAINIAKEDKSFVTEDVVIYIEDSYSKLNDEQRTSLDEKLGESYAEALQTVKAVICDYYIGQIDYEKGEPSKEELKKIVEAADVYNSLSDSAKTRVETADKYKRAIKEYSKYIANRGKTDKLYARRQYMEQCEEISADEILKYKSSYKDHLIKISVQFTGENGGITHTYSAVKVGTEEQFEIKDGRDKKEPAIGINEVVTIYGKITGTKIIKVTEEGTGWFNTSIFANVTDEYEVPVIEFVYTDIDNLGIIKSGDPNDTNTGVDDEFEEMIIRMNDYIE